MKKLFSFKSKTNPDRLTREGCNPGLAYGAAVTTIGDILDSFEKTKYESLKELYALGL